MTQPKKWDWKEKLGSRKFWIALVGCITGICGMIGFADSDIAIISFAVLELGSILGYCAVEGHVDAAQAKQVLTVLMKLVEMVEERKPTPPIDPPKPVDPVVVDPVVVVPDKPKE